MSIHFIKFLFSTIIFTLYTFNLFPNDNPTYKVGVTNKGKISYYDFQTEDEFIKNTLDKDSIVEFHLNDTSILRLPSFIKSLCKSCKYVFINAPYLQKIDTEFVQFNNLAKLVVVAPLDSGICGDIFILQNIEQLYLYDLKCSGELFFGFLNKVTLKRLQELKLSIKSPKADYLIPLHLFSSLDVLSIEGLVDNINAEKMFLDNGLCKKTVINNLTLFNISPNIPQLQAIPSQITLYKVDKKFLLSNINNFGIFHVMQIDKALAYQKFSKRELICEYILNSPNQPSICISNFEMNERP
ncbi:MAG: hypothetical protein K1X55_01925 [Chitinophagales bacterium]|nr:hypothetical protein [Chitinophagales bacterium]